MRQKRAKAYRKLMHVYCMSFGFRQPYQVLVDSEMCLEAVSLKIDLAKQLTVVLQGTVKPMITQCCVHRLYLAGRTAQPAVDLAKTFERRRCNHREAIPEVDCLKEVVGQTNKHRYVLSAQSSSIRQYARQVPGVPLVHIKRSVIVLEPASEATERVKSMMEIGRMKPSEAESSNIASTLEKSYATNTDASPIKKKQGPKAPNPLSVKKKKPKENNRQTQSRKHQEQAQSVGSKRKHENDDDDGDGDAQQQEGMDSRPTSQTTSKRTRKRVRKRKRLGMEDSEGGSAINAEVATS
ncbi:hypothetical protein ACEPAF_3567 [Sanghuangporus sanghuang]